MGCKPIPRTVPTQANRPTSRNYLGMHSFPEQYSNRRFQCSENSVLYFLKACFTACTSGRLLKTSVQEIKSSQTTILVSIE
jgi:hypothetical protein